MHHGKRRTPSWAIIPSGAINLINFFMMMMMMLKKDGDDEMNWSVTWGSSPATRYETVMSVFIGLYRFNIYLQLNYSPLSISFII